MRRLFLLLVLAVLPVSCDPNEQRKTQKTLVPGVGLEPTRPSGQGILSPPRLPVTPPGLDCRLMLREWFDRHRWSNLAASGMDLDGIDAG